MSTIASGISGAAVEFDLSGLDAAMDRISVALTDLTGGPMATALDQAGRSYLLDTLTRYGEQSAGGGEWPDLAISTKIKRLYKMGIKAGRLGRGQHMMWQLAESYKLPILIDTGHLYMSLVPDQPDNVFFPYPNGIAVGTAVGYANFHQTGGQNLPMRRILVDPSDPTMPEGSLGRIAALLTAGVRETLSEAITGE